MIELRKIHVVTVQGQGVVSIPMARNLFGMRQRDVLDCLARGIHTVDQKSPYGAERITLTTSGS